MTLLTEIAQSPGQQPVLIRFHELGPVDRVLHWVATPSVIYLLLVLGFAALAFELTQPGFGFAGFSGVAMLDNRRILAGALPAALLALAADAALGALERRLRPAR